MVCFGLKLGQDLKNRAAQPQLEFRGVITPGLHARMELKRQHEPIGQFNKIFTIVIYKCSHCFRG